MREDFTGKKVLIAGKGISGSGAYTALVEAGAKCAYADGTAWDDFGADLIVVSPGIPSSQPIFSYAKARGIELYGEVELGYRLCDKPIIAITGTNGKTTVTRLIGSMLAYAGYKVAVCGNVGESFALAAKRSDYDYAVVETSSFQLDTIVKFKPHIAVITNISPDHLDRHGDMNSYIAAKLGIAKNLGADDRLVLSADDIPVCALQGFSPGCNVIYTSVRGKVRGAYVHDGYIYCCGEKICEIDRIKSEGMHNVKNVLSAVCVARILGVRNSAIIESVTSFTPDAHRISLVARVRGKNYYDDSKGTNIMASVRAAESMCGSTCMIVGGSDKGYEYDGLFEQLPSCVVRIVAVGATARKIVEAAERNGFGAISVFDDFKEAFECAAEGEEENVLLSPASASFDMFSSYAERGEVFERLVRNEIES